jgi:hypothetical protein
LVRLEAPGGALQLSDGGGSPTESPFRMALQKVIVLKPEAPVPVSAANKQGSTTKRRGVWVARLQSEI